MRKYLLIFFIVAVSVFAQGAEWIKENYTKIEYRIPMRDGITLYTSVYSPRDTSKTYPMLMVRSPYTSSPYGADNYPGLLGPPTLGEKFARDGFIFVFQDVRGKFMSEGEYDNMRAFMPNKKSSGDIDESSDTYDTIDWLIKNVKHHNGKVGMWGISYPGFYAAMGLIESHPALVAVSPQAPISDWFVGDDMHHNGALTLAMSFNFFKSFDQPRDSLTTTWKSIDNYASPDMYNFFLKLGSIKNVNEKYFHNKLPFWNSIIKHGTYDEFWKSRNNIPHFKNVKPAVLIVGGWYDSEDLYGPLKIYNSIEEKNQVNNNYLVMGPWSHGGWARSDGGNFGDFKFPDNTSEIYNNKILIPFFYHYLKGEGGLNIPEVTTYRTGVNQWMSYDKYPPENLETKKLFFANKEKLVWESPETVNNYSEYMSDPNNPVPYTAKFHDSGQMYFRTYMTEDQRFASARPDVIEFTTETLDKDVTLVGPIIADLRVSTTGTDADFVVKLIDVYPDDALNFEKGRDATEIGGYQRLVRFEIMRGKFRNSLENPEPFKPGEITKIKFELNDVDHTFQKGHKIMVQLQSSMFPLFDRNPQKFIDIYNASDDDFQKALHKIYFGKENPSSISFKIY